MNHAHPRFALVACGAGVLLAALLPLTAHAVDLTVEVKGVGVEKGSVMVALYKQTDTWMRKPSMVQMQAGKKEGVSLTFKDLADGEYAISLFVDENGNGKLDSNAIGIPLEPFAFSNDAMGNFGPPSFEQAKFVVGKESNSISINLK